MEGRDDGGVVVVVWKISTMKVPPVEGWRATSPRLVEKVERSSWANLFWGRGSLGQ